MVTIRKVFPIRLSIVGSVVEFSPATRETGVRFPDNARFSNRSRMSVIAGFHDEEGSFNSGSVPPA